MKSLAARLRRAPEAVRTALVVAVLGASISALRGAAASQVHAPAAAPESVGGGGVAAAPAAAPAADPFSAPFDAAGLRAPAPAPPQSAAEGPLSECLQVPTGLCLKGAQGTPGVVVSPDATVQDMVLWYRFDKSLPVDESGRSRHLLDEAGALSPVPVGPGVMGRGGSAAFDGRGVRRRVPRLEAFESRAFTVTLWLYLLEDSVGSWRTIFSRGSNPDQTSPALLLRPDSRRLHVRVASPRVEGGSLEATGLLPMRRWTHIAVTSTGSVLRLYVNGLKDGEVIVEEPGATADAVEELGAEGGGDLHIGADPWRAGTKSYLDDFRWYDRALSQAEIKSMTLPSLTGMGADFVSLGCSSCKFADAQRSCGRRSHLCTVQELFSGGLHTARVMGWLAISPEVWFHEAQGDERFTETYKLGLCCTN